MIKLFHVYKTFDDRTVLDDVSLQVEKGNICCIVGPNGAGKSTLLKMMFCQEQADRGQVMINSQNLTRVHRREVPSVRRRMGFVFEDLQLMGRKSVLENITLALTIAGTSKKRGQHNMDRVLTTLELGSRKHEQTSELSAGEQQRVCIARAVVSDPLVLLADEPTASLDATLTAAVFDLFRGMSARGTTVVIATQKQDVADQFPQHRLVLNQGRVVNAINP